jgi:hypothetical protein
LLYKPGTAVADRRVGREGRIAPHFEISYLGEDTKLIRGGACCRMLRYLSHPRRRRRRRPRPRRRRLRFPSPYNHFASDAMIDRVWDIAQMRYVAKCMRTCLGRGHPIISPWRHQLTSNVRRYSRLRESLSCSVTPDETARLHFLRQSRIKAFACTNFIRWDITPCHISSKSLLNP